MKIGQAGTLESNDAVFTVSESTGREVEIQSIVMDYFGEQISGVINGVLSEHKMDNVKVVCVDKGALDCTLKARLITAIERFKASK